MASVTAAVNVAENVGATLEFDGGVVCNGTLVAATIDVASVGFSFGTNHTAAFDGEGDIATDCAEVLK